MKWRLSRAGAHLRPANLLCDSQLAFGALKLNRPAQYGRAESRTEPERANNGSLGHQKRVSWSVTDEDVSSFFSAQLIRYGLGGQLALLPCCLLPSAFCLLPFALRSLLFALCSARSRRQAYFASSPPAPTAPANLTGRGGQRRLDDCDHLEIWPANLVGARRTRSSRSTSIKRPQHRSAHSECRPAARAESASSKQIPNRPTKLSFDLLDLSDWRAVVVAIARVQTCSRCRFRAARGKRFRMCCFAVGILRRIGRIRSLRATTLHKTPIREAGKLACLRPLASKLLCSPTGSGEIRCVSRT